MAYGLIGLYGLFLIFVGSNGNSGTLKSKIAADAKGFAPWLIAILVLRALYASDTLKPIVKPFIFLALLTFFLKNYGVVATQINEITGLKLPTEGKTK